MLVEHQCTNEYVTQMLEQLQNFVDDPSGDISAKKMAKVTYAAIASIVDPDVSKADMIEMLIGIASPSILEALRDEVQDQLQKGLLSSAIQRRGENVH